MRKYVAAFFISAICLVTTIAQGRVVPLRRKNGAWEYNEQSNNKREIKIGVNTNEIEGTIQVMHSCVSDIGKGGVFRCEKDMHSPDFVIYLPQVGKMHVYIADKADGESEGNTIPDKVHSERQIISEIEYYIIFCMFIN